MLQKKNDFVKYGCERIGKYWYVKLGKKMYKLKKSKHAINYSPIHISDYMSGKMENIVAISTPCTCNELCKKYMKDPNKICASCYANAILEMRKGGRGVSLRLALESNYELLTTEIVPMELIPIFPNLNYERIEAFGDLANVTQAINYIHIAQMNPHITFAWWTKNMHIVEKAVEECGGKPSNVIIVQSSFYVNKQDVKHPLADKVFTVYTKEFAEEHNIEINCGARCCATCLRCYKHNTETYINELLKN